MLVWQAVLPSLVNLRVKPARCRAYGRQAGMLLLQVVRLMTSRIGAVQAQAVRMVPSQQPLQAKLTLACCRAVTRRQGHSRTEVMAAAAAAALGATP